MNEWRGLSLAEAHLLLRLLEADFPGNVGLQEQMKTVTARVVDENGSLGLHVEGDGPRAKVLRRVPVEAEYVEEDGVRAHVLVHVADGLLKELEAYREDLGPIRVKPSDAVNAPNFTIIVL